MKNDEKKPELEPLFSFDITFRSPEHFREMIKWLNENVGRGKENWTLNGRVLRHLKQSKQITRKVLIYNESFDPDVASWLALK